MGGISNGRESFFLFDNHPESPTISIHHVLTERIEIVELQPELFNLLQKYGRIEIRIVHPITYSSWARDLPIPITYNDFLSQRIIESQS